MKQFFAKLWATIKAAAKQLSSLVTDKEWDLDVYRVGGIAAYVVAGILALRTSALVTELSDTKLGIMAGLVSAIAAIGTTLFSQARKNDVPGAA
jgi:nitrate/nitrite transporter NarK